MTQPCTHRLTILQGDCRAVLKTLPDEGVQCVITSPPYWGLRDYGTATWEGGDEQCDHKGRSQTSDSSTLGEWKQGGGQHYKEAARGIPFAGMCGKCGAKRIDAQIGLEATPELYVATMVEVFREMRRVLKDDGTAWLVIGDSYCSTAPGTGMAGNSKTSTLVRHARLDAQDAERAKNIRPMTPHGLKPKDLVGIPWRVAFALQDDGWYLRSDIIWHKPAPMPESVTDRCTRSHEYVFMFSKSARYYYDADAIKERSAESSQERANYGWNGRTGDTKGALTVGARTGSTLHKMKSGQVGMEAMCPTMVNKRDVWTVQTGNCKDAHFAVFPPDLIKPCVLAGCPIGGTVLDPFGGSGTTGMVAIELGRKAILIELNPEYVELAKARCDVTPGLPL